MPSQTAGDEPGIDQIERLILKINFLIQVSDLKQNILSIITSHLKSDIESCHLDIGQPTFR